METINFSKPVNFPTSITCIKVEKLFGKYNYRLQKEENSFSNDSLIILYGDNGSGKTTILKLLFHILSTSSRRGHQTFIAETPFCRFSIEFSDRTKIIITRNGNTLTGAFNIVCLKGTEQIAEARYEFKKGKLDSEDAHFLKKLSDLNLNLFMLGDDRVLDSDIFYAKEDKMKNEIESLISKLEVIESKININAFFKNQSSVNLKSALESSIRRVEKWIKEQEYQGSDRGEENVHNIYEKVAQNIITSDQNITADQKEVDNFENEFNELIKDFEEQEKRSQEYSRFGLIPPLNTKKLVDILKNKTLEKTYSISILRNVLTPYLKSITARMEALQTIQEILTTFVNTINGFFHDKKIRFHVRDGLAILTEENGQEMSLDPEMLSSGEKQLLLLFCNTIAAREKPTIFIIDEPEISLNIKWQRKLIQSLLKCTEGSQIQFLLATHSIELLSQYDNDVVDLENIKEEKEYGEETTRETAIAS